MLFAGKNCFSHVILHDQVSICTPHLDTSNMHSHPQHSVEGKNKVKPEIKKSEGAKQGKMLKLKKQNQHRPFVNSTMSKRD